MKRSAVELRFQPVKPEDIPKKKGAGGGTAVEVCAPCRQVRSVGRDGG